MYIFLTGATQKSRIDLKAVKATGDMGFGKRLYHFSKTMADIMKSGQTHLIFVGSNKYVVIAKIG